VSVDSGLTERLRLTDFDVIVTRRGAWPSNLFNGLVHAADGLRLTVNVTDWSCPVGHGGVS
jgi:hypothetical protein